MRTNRRNYVDVMIDSGELPSAKGKKGYELDRVLQRWHTIAHGTFRYDCKALLQMIDEVDELRMWEYYWDGFYKTRDEFLEKKVLIDFDLTEESLNQIVGRLRGGEKVRLTPLGTHGGDRKSEGVKNQDRQSTLIGRASDYRLARLRRDRPEILEAYNRGEYHSVRAAAIAAGIVKVKTPLDQLCSWWAKANNKERAAFRAKIESES